MKRHTGFRLIAAVLVYSQIVWPTLVAAQSSRGGKSVGIVTTISGEATVQRADRPAQTLPLKFKDELYFKDRISTKQNSVARVLMGGRSLVTVRELSELTVTEEPGKASFLDLFSGKIALAVAKLKMRPGETIEVRTPNAVAAVRGTVLVAEVTPASGNGEAKPRKTSFTPGATPVQSQNAQTTFYNISDSPDSLVDITPFSGKTQSGGTITLKPGQFLTAALAGVTTGQMTPAQLQQVIKAYQVKSLKQFDKAPSAVNESLGEATAQALAVLEGTPPGGEPLPILDPCLFTDCAPVTPPECGPCPPRVTVTDFFPDTLVLEAPLGQVKHAADGGGGFVSPFFTFPSEGLPAPDATVVPVFSFIDEETGLRVFEVAPGPVLEFDGEEAFPTGLVGTPFFVLTEPGTVPDLLSGGIELTNTHVVTDFCCFPVFEVSGGEGFEERTGIILRGPALALNGTTIGDFFGESSGNPSTVLSVQNGDLIVPFSSVITMGNHSITFEEDGEAFTVTFPSNIFALNAVVEVRNEGLLAAAGDIIFADHTGSNEGFGRIYTGGGGDTVVRVDSRGTLAAGGFVLNVTNTDVETGTVISVQGVNSSIIAGGLIKAVGNPPLDDGESFSVPEVIAFNDLVSVRDGAQLTAGEGLSFTNTFVESGFGCCGAFLVDGAGFDFEGEDFFIVPSTAVIAGNLFTLNNTEFIEGGENGMVGVYSGAFLGVGGDVISATDSSIEAFRVIDVCCTFNEDGQTFFATLEAGGNLVTASNSGIFAFGDLVSVCCGGQLTAGGGLSFTNSEVETGFCCFAFVVDGGGFDSGENFVPSSATITGNLFTVNNSGFFENGETMVGVFEGAVLGVGGDVISAQNESFIEAPVFIVVAGSENNGSSAVLSKLTAGGLIKANNSELEAFFDLVGVFEGGQVDVTGPNALEFSNNSFVQSGTEGGCCAFVVEDGTFTEIFDPDAEAFKEVFHPSSATIFGNLLSVTNSFFEELGFTAVGVFGGANLAVQGDLVKVSRTGDFLEELDLFASNRLVDVRGEQFSGFEGEVVTHSTLVVGGSILSSSGVANTRVDEDVLFVANGGRVELGSAPIISLNGGFHDLAINEGSAIVNLTGNFVDEVMVLNAMVVNGETLDPVFRELGTDQPLTGQGGNGALLTGANLFTNKGLRLDTARLDVVGPLATLQANGAVQSNLTSSSDFVHLVQNAHLNITVPTSAALVLNNSNLTVNNDGDLFRVSDSSFLKVDGQLASLASTLNIPNGVLVRVEGDSVFHLAGTSLATLGAGATLMIANDLCVEASCMTIGGVRILLADDASELNVRVGSDFVAFIGDGNVDLGEDAAVLVLSGPDSIIVLGSLFAGVARVDCAGSPCATIINSEFTLTQPLLLAEAGDPSQVKVIEGSPFTFVTEPEEILILAKATGAGVTFPGGILLDNTQINVSGDVPVIHINGVNATFNDTVLALTNNSSITSASDVVKIASSLKQGASSIAPMFSVVDSSIDARNLIQVSGGTLDWNGPVVHLERTSGGPTSINLTGAVLDIDGEGGFVARSLDGDPVIRVINDSLTADSLVKSDGGSNSFQITGTILDLTNANVTLNRIKRVTGEDFDSFLLTIGTNDPVIRMQDSSLTLNDPGEELVFFSREDTESGEGFQDGVALIAVRTLNGDTITLNGPALRLDGTGGTLTLNATDAQIQLTNETLNQNNSDSGLIEVSGTVVMNGALVSAINSEIAVTGILFGVEGAFTSDTTNALFDFTGTTVDSTASNQPLIFANGNMNVTGDVIRVSIPDSGIPGVSGPGGLVVNASQPVMVISGGIHQLATADGASIFNLIGFNLSADELGNPINDLDTGAPIAIDQPVRGGSPLAVGLFSGTNDAQVTTNQLAKVDKALVDAIAVSLLSMAGTNPANSSFTAANSDLFNIVNQAKLNANVADAIVSLNASSLNVRNLFNVANLSVLNVIGNLFSLNNNSSLTASGLVSVSGGSAFNLTGSFGSFGLTGVNTLTINNNLCAVAGACVGFTVNGFSFNVAGAAGNVSVAPTFVPFTGSAGTANGVINIAPNAAVITVADTSKVTLK